uniref:hypothetical protein n=1 Tax=Trichocoleus desertorum TaxID=1481672 RepID=UPI0025B38450|nr:hypothetical protein [Trichocoleus desertorum]
MKIPHSLLFGEGFYQDSQVIKIQKSSLHGLTPLPNNTAESLLAGLVLQAESAFTGVLLDEDEQPLLDELNKPLEYDSSLLYESLQVSLWRFLFQTKKGVPVATHTFLIQFFASPTIPYEQPIEPKDLEL